MTDTKPGRGTATIPTPKAALAAPFASAIVAAAVALASGDSPNEAAFAAVATGFGAGLGLLNVLALARPGSRRVPWLSAALVPALLLLSCYAYGRLAGHSPTDIRAGLACVLAALGLAAVANSAWGVSRTRKAVAASHVEAADRSA